MEALEVENVSQHLRNTTKPPQQPNMNRKEREIKRK